MVIGGLKATIEIENKEKKQKLENKGRRCLPKWVMEEIDNDPDLAHTDQ